MVADGVDVAARRDAQLDLMADLLDAHLDVDAITGLVPASVSVYGMVGSCKHDPEKWKPVFR